MGAEDVNYASVVFKNCKVSSPNGKLFIIYLISYIFLKFKICYCNHVIDRCTKTNCWDK